MVLHFAGWAWFVKIYPDGDQLGRTARYHSNEVQVVAAVVCWRWIDHKLRRVWRARGSNSELFKAQTDIRVLDENGFNVSRHVQNLCWEVHGNDVAHS